MTYTRVEIQPFLAKKGFEIGHSDTRYKKLVLLLIKRWLESRDLARDRSSHWKKDYPEVTVSYEFVVLWPWRNW